jgi:hypothetical protein
MKIVLGVWKKIKHEQCHPRDISLLIEDFDIFFPETARNQRINVGVSSTNTFPNGMKQAVFWSILLCSKNYGHYREEKVSQIWLYTQYMN